MRMGRVEWSKLTAGLGLSRCPSPPDGAVAGLSGRKHVGPADQEWCGDLQAQIGVLCIDCQECRSAGVPVSIKKPRENIYWVRIIGCMYWVLLPFRRL